MTLQSLLGFTEPSDLIYNPNNEENPLILKVFKNDTKHYKQVFRDFSNKTFIAFKNDDNRDGDTLKIDVQNELNLEFLASLVADWSGLTDNETGEQVQFNYELLKDIMKESLDLVRTINAFVEQTEGK